MLGPKSDRKERVGSESSEIDSDSCKKTQTRDGPSRTGTRVLRSSTIHRKLNIPSENVILKRCHLCRQKLEMTMVVSCSSETICRHSFCWRCLEKYHKTEVKKERIKKGSRNWICFVCRGTCKCDRCKADLAKDLELLEQNISPAHNLHKQSKQTVANEHKGIFIFRKLS